jgi:hypothetical protein
MRATEFIRGLLDLIDSVESHDETPSDYVDEVPEVDVEIDTQYSNSPDEMYADEDTLFSIGNDINKPKHPSDLRTDSFSLYPNMQYKSGK